MFVQLLNEVMNSTKLWQMRRQNIILFVSHQAAAFYFKEY
ncbi:hypothetical protein LPE509_00946 [Legionella pneumophila subsp. pneumophila LPE509]|nr:hypothetical protein LPE509_00946 [Legionella pneumophila subsp. pneumophila LPE509]